MSLTSGSVSGSYWSGWIDEFRQLERDIVQLKAFWDAPALDAASRDPAEALAPAQELFQQASSVCRGLEKTRRLAERLPTASSLTTTIATMVSQNEHFLGLLSRVLGDESGMESALPATSERCSTPSPVSQRYSTEETIRCSSPWPKVAPKTPNIDDLRLASSTLAQLKMEPNENPSSPVARAPAVDIDGDTFEGAYRRKVSEFVQRQLSANELATWWQRFRERLGVHDHWCSASELLETWSQERTRVKLALLALTQMDLLTTRWDAGECAYALNQTDGS
jgi:hypothetical protein